MAVGYNSIFQLIRIRKCYRKKKQERRQTKVVVDDFPGLFVVEIPNVQRNDGWIGSIGLEKVGVWGWYLHFVLVVEFGREESCTLNIYIRCAKKRDRHTTGEMRNHLKFPPVWVEFDFASDLMMSALLHREKLESLITSTL